MTAEWSVHGFAGTEKRAVWRKLTPSRRRQRTTMKACLFTVTKCHKNAQSHRAPTCAPTPARCRVHSRARPRQLHAPPQNPHIHTFKSSSKCSTANPFEGKGVLPTPHGHMSHTVTLEARDNTKKLFLDFLKLSELPRPPKACFFFP